MTAPQYQPPPEFHPDPQQPEAPIDGDALIHWVHTTLLPLLERSTRTVTWCPRWWEHPEACFRFELLRRSWQAAVSSDDGMALSFWMLQHVDPHLAVLTGPAGPFADCGWSERRGYLQPHQPRGLPQHWPEDFDTHRFAPP